MTTLVDLADEFQLTTVEALEICDRLGIPASGRDAELDDAQSERFRAALVNTPAPDEEQPGSSPLRIQTDATLDFSRVPDSWASAARTPPPPEPGSGGLERSAVVAFAVACLSVVMALFTGLCGGIFALFPLGLSVKADRAIEAKQGKGKIFVTLTRVVVVLAFVSAAAVSWIAWSGDVERLPAIAVVNAVAPGEFRSADSVEVGDCINDPGSVLGLRELRIVQVIPCDDPHDVEFFEQVDQYGITAIDDLDDYPGASELANFMPGACETSFETFVGTPLGTSSLVLYLLYPTERGWESGDRTLLCGVMARDGSQLEGTQARAGV